MEDASVPFDLIVLADLAPGKDFAGRVEAVDKDTLDPYLREASPWVEIPSGKIASRITILEYRDFRPERLARQWPPAADLLDLRTRALDLAAGRGSWPALKEALLRPRAEPLLLGAREKTSEDLAPTAPLPSPPRPTPPPPAPGTRLDDLVDLEGSQTAGSAEPPPAPVDFGKILEAVAGSPKSSEGPAPRELRRLAEDAEKALGETLRSVLHSASFRRLESAWRGLRYLVRSLDFRAGQKLHVIPVSEARLLEAVKEVAFPLADDLRSRGRVACLLADHELYPSDPAWDGALEIARGAAPRSLPVLLSLKSDGSLLRLAESQQDPARAGWKRLRGADEARWLVFAQNRFLLRTPYGRELDPVRDFEFEEGAGPLDPHLWGSPVWLLGALLGASFARTGWGVDFAGVASQEGPEPLPTWTYRPKNLEETEIPLEELLAEASARQLDEAGLLPLSCRRNSDRAFAAGTASVFGAPAGAPGASLRLAMAAAQIASKLESLLPYLDFSKGPGEVSRTLGAGLELLGLSARGPEFTVRAGVVREGRPAVDLTILPGAFQLRGLPEIRFQVPLPLG